MRIDPRVRIYKCTVHTVRISELRCVVLVGDAGGAAGFSWYTPYQKRVFCPFQKHLFYRLQNVTPYFIYSYSRVYIYRGLCDVYDLYDHDIREELDFGD